MCFDDVNSFLQNVQDLMKISYKAQLKNHSKNNIAIEPSFIFADLFDSI